jgi:nitrogen fixation NifU-like protein
MSKIKDLYSKKAMDHFEHPRNIGQIKNPSGVGRVGNPTCGDLMELQILVSEKKGVEYIKDAKFQTFGCGAAVATSSILTEMVIGKTLDGLPPVKKHCSVLAEEALKKAIDDYKRGKK